MLASVAPLFHTYAVPPLAINVVLAPVHISISPLILAIGSGCTVTVTLVEA